MSDAIHRLVLLVERLRRECPWDREQTFATVQTFLLEEAHEVLEAVDREAPDQLLGELGDLLFQVLFLSRLAQERGWFGIEEVAASIERKMIERHPHVFGPEKASDASQVKANWEKKKREGRNPPGDPLGSVPKALPALSAALRMSERAADLGFEWERDSDLLAKVEEEIGEARRESEVGNRAGTEEELGDLLFALVNWARRGRIDPERALRLANEKFRRRFHRVAEIARAEGRDVSKFSAGELDGFWNRVKEEEKASSRKPGTP
ncbi:MAG: nucleoside triphosphate pyrophosphohydrolase [Thermoanaerobaculia bacterium]